MNKTHVTKPRNHTEDMALNKHNMHKSILNGYNDAGSKIFFTPKIKYLNHLTPLLTTGPISSLPLPKP